MGVGSDGPDAREVVTMAVTKELASAQQGLDAVERAVAAVERRYGPCTGVRRLRSDVRRVREDLEELAALSPPPVAAQESSPVFVPDTDYDPAFWRDVEDEGLGHPGL